MHDKLEGPFNQNVNTATQPERNAFNHSTGRCTKQRYNWFVCLLQANVPGLLVTVVLIALEKSANWNVCSRVIFLSFRMCITNAYHCYGRFKYSSSSWYSLFSALRRWMRMYSRAFIWIFPLVFFPTSVVILHKTPTDVCKLLNHFSCFHK